MKIKNRQDLLVAITLGVVALAVAVNFIFPPMIGWWSDRQGQIQKLEKQVYDGNQMIRREQVLRSKWDDMRHNALPSNMPQAEQQFLKAMEGWSHESGVEITSILPQWRNDATNYLTLDCRVESTGDLSALSRFIYAIERGPLMVRLDSVELSAHDNDGRQLTLGMDINGLDLLQNATK